jgi:hypothetical protein
MPPFQLLATLTASGGYRPISSLGGPDVRPDTLWRGRDFWIRPGGRLKPTLGSAQVSSQNVGTKIYALDQYRGEIAGGLVSGSLPKESLIRYQGSALFFVSENTNQQVYINESTSSPFTLTGVTTSSIASKLRVALLDGATYTAYDAGIQPPASIGTVSTETGGGKSMDGIVSIVACARRTITDTTSNPTPASVQTLSSGGNNRIRVVLPALASGTDAWWYGGTAWGSGNFGPWRLIREVRSIVQGTSTFTNGSNAFTGSQTSYLTDLRNGDRVTINATNYYVGITTNSAGALYSDAALTTPINFAGATGTYSIQVTEIVLDWRNGELTDLIEFDNDVPPLLDGVLNFNDILFGWRGNTFYSSKIGNPEGWPAALARCTQSQADIIAALPGDNRIYLLTRNGLEVVTFTQQEGAPFLLRQVWAFGFSSPTQAVISEGVLYAAVGTSSGVRIIRTRIDDSPDLELSADIESDLNSWTVADVVMALDPANAAVLAMYNNGSYTTTIPFMLQQNQWSLPQLDANGLAKCSASVANRCYMTLLVGSNYRVYQFEGGNGTGLSRYATWPFIDKDGLRQVLKRIKVTGDVDSLYIYAIVPGVAVPSVSEGAGGATAGPYALGGSLRMSTMIQTNVPNAQAFAIQLNSDDADAEITEVGVFGFINQIWR